MTRPLAPPLIVTIVSLVYAIVALLSCVSCAQARGQSEVAGSNAGRLSSYRYGNNFGSYFRRSPSLDKGSLRDGNQQLSRHRDRYRDRMLHDSSGSVHRPAAGEGRLNLTGVRLANEHLLKIRTSHRCRHPRPRLVRVKDYYQGPDKVYLPRCTVLHKCDDESGCCENEALHCVAKHQEPVNLFFYVVLVNGSSVEMLTFTNDTECECREVNYMPRNKELAPWSATPSTTTTTTTTTTSTTPSTSDLDYFGLDEKKLQKPSGGGSEDLAVAVVDPDENQLQLNKGKEILCSHVDCPNPFAAQLVTSHSEGRGAGLGRKCKCDCHHDDHKCLRIKHGHRRLDPAEARCVLSNECLEPQCEYAGEFDKYSGACPRKEQAHGSRQHHRLRHQKHYMHLQERD